MWPCISHPLWYFETNRSAIQVWSLITLSRMLNLAVHLYLIECGRSNVTWLARLGHKKQHNFWLVSWETSFVSLSHDIRTIWGYSDMRKCRPHEEAMWLFLSSSPTVIPAHLQHGPSDSVRQFQALVYKSPQLLFLSSWGFTYRRDMSWFCHILYTFQTHRIHELNLKKILIFDDLLHK